MSIWFLVWLFLSLTLLYFFGWTLLIMQRQKKGWAFYAKKRGLRFTKGAIDQAPTMDGVIKDYTFSFFPAQYEVGDVRHNRKMTAIEITLKSEMPFDGFIASGMLVDVVKTSGLVHEIKPEHPEWQDDNILLTDKPEMMNAYLTPQRLDIVTRWMNMKNMWFILGFRNDVFLLRVDTSSPIENPKRLNALVNALLKDIPVLELADGEGATLRQAQAE